MLQGVNNKSMDVLGFYPIVRGRKGGGDCGEDSDAAEVVPGRDG